MVGWVNGGRGTGGGEGEGGGVRGLGYILSIILQYGSWWHYNYNITVCPIVL